MRSISFEKVTLRRGHLAEKEKLARRATIPAVYKQFCDSGRVGAFKCDWKEGKEPKPHYFWDSDVAKWIEGAANVLIRYPSKSLEAKVERIIDDIERNQREDGYFNIYHMIVAPGTEWTERNHHELYCAGHLLEGAIAYYEATGKRRFLSLMEKYIDYIYRIFVVEKSAQFVTPGHQEIELALVRLWRATGSERALELAKFFVENRGVADEPMIGNKGYMYAQDDHPVREMREAKGHAVRALYYYCAVADLAAVTGDAALLETCRAIYHDIVTHKMYVTGGLGFPYGEAFSEEPDFLPNDTAYTETCAAIAMVMFCARMQNIEKKSCYADVIELELYNGMISGISLSGDAFFYENPLEINRKQRRAAFNVIRQTKIIERVEDFSCSCCPPNICRFLTSLGSLVYSVDGGDLYVNQFADSDAELDGISVSTRTAYPTNGKIAITAKGAARVFIRIPAWCKKFTLNLPYTIENGYAVIENNGTEILLDLEIKPRLLTARSTVANCEGRVAVARGPIVYCIEEVDNGACLDAIYLSRRFTARLRKESEFGSLPVLLTNGYRRAAADALYAEEAESSYEKTEIKLIPYACFANRGESDMLVWMNVR